MEHTFPTIVAEGMTAQPIKYYHVQRGGHVVARVVIYQLVIPDAGLEARIPYYVSDGHTNRLRGNILYPFICFTGVGGACPSSYKHGPGVLLKYHVGKNISTDMISDYIYRELHRERPSEQSVVGLESVLPRLVNLLDYLIAINGHYVVNYDKSRVRCYRPLEDQPEGTKYNMSICRPGEPDSDDKFRNYILVALQDQARHMQQYSLIRVKYHEYAPEKIEDSVFNDMINVTGDFDHNAANVARYARISEELHKRFKARVAKGYATTQHDMQRFAGEPVILAQVKKANDFYGKLNMLLLDRHRPMSYPDHVLSTILRGWGCRVDGNYQCSCGAKFTDRDEIIAHIAEVHPSPAASAAK